MASDPQIANFDAAAVRTGLRLAMQVGLPVVADDRPRFFMPTTVTTTSGHTSDSEGTPFQANYRPTRSAPVSVQVPCAVEYKDAAGNLQAAGTISASGVLLTLLDEDYLQVKGFAYVVIGGIKYNYERTVAPMGLVSVGVYQIYALADDEG